MRKRWRVVAVGDGWEYRSSTVHEYVLRASADRFAREMNELGRLDGMPVPLTLIVERIPS